MAALSLQQRCSFTGMCPGLHHLSYAITDSPPPFLLMLSLVLSARSSWNLGSTTGTELAPLARLSCWAEISRGDGRERWFIYLMKL